MVLSSLRVQGIVKNIGYMCCILCVICIDTVFGCILEPQILYTHTLSVPTV